MGKKRNIALRTQHYLPTPNLVANTNFALTVPKSFAEVLVAGFSTRYLDLPFEVPNQESFLYWHESTDRDQANIWMRKIIADGYRH
jgi:hypothetical protein